VIRITGQDGGVAGELSDEQFALLREQFEAEGIGDRDYYVDAATLEMLQEAGADERLLAVLRAAVAPSGAGEVGWSRV
jgi:hypothetical protein